MRDHEIRLVVGHARKNGMSPLRAVREHLGMSRAFLARKVRLDPACLAACEDHEGVARPETSLRHALARCLGVPADLLFDLGRRTA